MSPSSRGLILTRSLSCLLHQWKTVHISSIRRKFSINNKVCVKEKLTVELLPEVEKSLACGEMKHRKHPGVRKIEPVSVPEVLKANVDSIIGDKFETLLHEKAEELWRHLIHRRLPMEKEDIDKKIQAKVPQLYGLNYEELSEVLTRQQMKQLRRSINLEAGRWKPVEYDRFTSLAYLVARLAPNYASTKHVFGELIKYDPTFKPQTYFDFGSGVGSGLWAAHSLWSDSIKEYFCTDISADMNDICLSLITDEITEQKHIEPVYFRQFLPASESVKYDVVVSAFSLLDLPSVVDRLKVIDTLWRKTNQYLIVIEYGTHAGFSCVLDARDYILKIANDDSPEMSSYSSGAHVISPCPHDHPCPKFLEKSNSSCGFVVPYHPQFPRHHQSVILKDWISYVVIKKSHRPVDSKTLPRIVKYVMRRPRHVICRLCCSDGELKEVIVTKAKQGRHAYRCARQSEQGDIFPGHVKPVEISEDSA